MTATSEAERNRRAEIMRDSRAAAVAPPRDQLTSLDRRKCPHGVIKLETTRLFWLMSPSAPKAAVARTLLDFAFVPIPEVKSEGSANQLTRP
jgi:hypothetical protein